MGQADARRRAVDLGVVEAIIKSMTACSNEPLVSRQSLTEKGTGDWSEPYSD